MAAPMIDLVSTCRAAVQTADVAALADDDRLVLLREVELLVRSAAALTARLQVAFRASQVAAQIEDGVAPSRAGAAVSDDLALARMTSPASASRELTSARALVTEMPCTLAALQAGVISAHQARIVTEATTTLEVEDRAEVDRRLADRLEGASTKEIRAVVHGLVYDVDPAGFVRRARRTAADRGVSVRPLPDVMALLSARLPAVEAVAVHKALHGHALAARASGDPRTVQQLMADELFHRLTGRTVVDGVDVEVGLVITDTALFAGAPDPADLEGYGPVPAETARRLLRPGAPAGGPPTNSGPVTEPQGAVGADAEQCPNGGRCTRSSCTAVHGYRAPASKAPVPSPPGASGRKSDSTASGAAGPSTTPGGLASSAPGSPGALTGQAPSNLGDDDQGARAATVWVRRLLTDPVTGQLTARDPRRRRFTGGLRSYLVARDRTCRNTWCGAPIRDIDHTLRARDGGSTTADNGRGLCQRCNLARERPRHLTPATITFRPPPPLLPWRPVHPRSGQRARAAGGSDSDGDGYHPPGGEAA